MDIQNTIPTNVTVPQVPVPQSPAAVDPIPPVQQAIVQKSGKNPLFIIVILLLLLLLVALGIIVLLLTKKNTQTMTPPVPKMKPAAQLPDFPTTIPTQASQSGSAIHSPQDLDAALQQVKSINPQSLTGSLDDVMNTIKTLTH